MQTDPGGQRILIDSSSLYLICPFEAALTQSIMRASLSSFIFVCCMFSSSLSHISQHFGPEAEGVWTLALSSFHVSGLSRQRWFDWRQEEAEDPLPSHPLCSSAMPSAVTAPPLLTETLVDASRMSLNPVAPKGMEWVGSPGPQGTTSLMWNWPVIP